MSLIYVTYLLPAYARCLSHGQWYTKEMGHDLNNEKYLPKLKCKICDVIFLVA